MSQNSKLKAIEPYSNPGKMKMIYSVIVLVKEMLEGIIVKKDLNSQDYPSIWLEKTLTNNSKLLICGHYREWQKNVESVQIEKIKKLQTR